MLIALGVIVFLIWVYILFLRDWMFSKWPQLETLRTIENKLWANSRTILMARFYWIAGILVTIQQIMGAAGIDITPFVTELAKAIPEQYRPLAVSGFLIATGTLFEWLRRVTTTSVGENESENQ